MNVPSQTVVSKVHHMLLNSIISKNPEAVNKAKDFYYKELIHLSFSVIRVKFPAKMLVRTDQKAGDPGILLR